MATTFQSILEKASNSGIANNKTKDSINWFKINVQKMTNVTSNKIIREEKDSLVNSWANVAIGKMYFAYYDPKHKETLPYYDSFPLMIPIQRYSDGFLALNLHYLPPMLRAKLLDALFATTNNAKLDENKKMILSYNILKYTSKNKLFEPCVKRYLGNHFRSRFVNVAHQNWTSAVFLPVETFEKQSKRTVWADSKERIGK